jgi:hypothetical protein
VVWYWAVGLAVPRRTVWDSMALSWGNGLFVEVKAGVCGVGAGGCPRVSRVVGRGGVRPGDGAPGHGSYPQVGLVIHSLWVSAQAPR